MSDSLHACIAAALEPCLVEIKQLRELNAELLEVCQNLLPRAASWLEDLHDDVFDGDDGHPDIVRAQKAIAKAEAMK